MVWLAHVRPDLYNREKVLKVAPDMPSRMSLWLASLAIRSMAGTASGSEYPPWLEKIFHGKKKIFHGKKKYSMERKIVFRGKKKKSTMERKKSSMERKIVPWHG